MKNSSFAIWTAVLATATTVGCAGIGQKQALPPVSPQGAVVGATEKSTLAKATDVVVQPASRMTKAVTTAFTKDTPESSDDALSLSKPAKKSPSLYVTLAQVHERSGNLAGAAEQYKLALKLDPAHLDALLGMAHLRDRQNEFAEADKFYREAVQRHPKAAIAHNDRGLCQARQGRLDEAAQSLVNAARLQPDKTLYRNNLATVLVHMGRPDDALQELTAVHPPAVANYNVGYLLAQQQHTQAAQGYFQEAVQIDPSFAPAHQWVAMLARQGAPADAPPSRSR